MVWLKCSHEVIVIKPRPDIPGGKKIDQAPPTVWYRLFSH
uniref:Uncharacterized protein n=1 Tax=Arundo donax TaxID=35708 RepID=A0A0A9G2N3_ARUDO